MKITDVTLTLLAWPGIPPTTYGRHTGRFGGGEPARPPDPGHGRRRRGHAFLGSAMRGAQADVVSLIETLKPVVLGQDPLDRERLYQALWQRSRSCILGVFMSRGKGKDAFLDYLLQFQNSPYVDKLLSKKLTRADLSEKLDEVPKLMLDLDDPDYANDLMDVFESIP